MMPDFACMVFVGKQLELFRTFVDSTMPRCIVVINAMASGLLKEGLALGQLQYDKALGVVNLITVINKLANERRNENKTKRNA